MTDHHVADDLAVVIGGDQRKIGDVLRRGPDAVDQVGLDVRSERGRDDPTDGVEVGCGLGADPRQAVASEIVRQTRSAVTGMST